MTQHIITTEAMAAFRRYLMAAERRPATITKYLREVQAFTQTLPPGGPVTKETVLAWKRTLVQTHAPSTVNGKLAALNTFFSFLGWGECRVKALRRQRELFRAPGRELHKGDYLRLLAAARQARNWRLYYLMETLASTGVRISELQYVTVANPPHRAGLGGREGEGQAGHPHPQAVPGAGQVLPAAGNHRWAGVRHPDGAAHGPVRTSGRNCTPCARRRGWRPGGSSPTTSATSLPGPFMRWRKT